MNTLPQTITIKSEAVRLAEQYRKLAAVASSAWQRLVAMSADLGEIPSPEKLSSGWLASVIDEKKKAITMNPALPSDTKNSLIKDWTVIHREASKAIAIIRRLYDAIPATNIKKNEFLEGLYVLDADGLASAAATVEVPEDAKTHYQLIVGVRDAVSALRTWEKEKEIKKYRLGVLIDHAGDTFLFAEKWARGDYHRQVLDDADRRKQQIYEETFL